MKKLILPLTMLGSILITGCITGCYSHHAALREPATAAYPTGELILMEAPPEPRREMVSNAPDNDHVWVAGYWTFTSGRWVWIPGHWELRPRPGVAWVPGHWEKNPSGRGWVRIQGQWE